MSRIGLFTIAIAAAVSACGQSVISAHSGTIHYTEGTVSLDGSTVQPKFGQFPEMKAGQVLATTEGRAEVLLTPGVFLRIGENSSFKMIATQLSDTRLEIQSGVAMLEVGELLPDNAIAVTFRGAQVALAKSGLYRFDAAGDPATLRVYDGDAKVTTGAGETMSVGRGHELAFGGAKLEAKGFDTKSTDELYRWSGRRDEYIAEANISAAKTTRDAGYSAMGYNSMSMMAGMGSWAWNPWFGMFTYLPYSGTFFSPYGFGYFSPFDVGFLYGPYSPFYYGNGYYGGGGVNGVGTTRVATGATSASTITRAAGRSGVFANTGLSTVGSARGGGLGAAGGSRGLGNRGGLGMAPESGFGGFSGGGVTNAGASSGSVRGGSVGMSSSGGGSVGGGHAGGGSVGHH